MKAYLHIEQKLHTFIKKYYTNELIRGLLLFFYFGLFLLIVTLLIEYFLWLEPVYRTILFWSFILLSIFLFINFIIFPIIKLLGFRNSISLEEASKIIGTHFKEIDDKLLNIIQLHNSNSNSELLLASIEQKSQDLEAIPFRRAINFYANKKYLVLLAIPLFIWFLFYISGNIFVFKSSLKRVVNHQVTYLPPAPFQFIINTNKLTTIQGKPFTINILTKGSIVPESVKIHYNEQEYFLKETSLGNFEYTFTNLQKDINFYLSANDITSVKYSVSVISTPNMYNFEMYLNYPNYTLKKNKKIKNTGNAVVPEGTKVTWNIKSKNTNRILLHNVSDSLAFNNSNDNFNLSKRLHKSLDYTISTSNKQLTNYENLTYTIQVLKDEFPKIIIKTNIDAINRGEVQFIGQLSDDYGVQKLLLIYYDKTNTASKKEFIIPINTSTFEEFQYTFPNGLDLDIGVDYEFYFELFDNDVIHGYKSVKSKSFNYHTNTSQELNEILLKEQKQSLDDFKSTSDKSEKMHKSLESLSKKMKSKSEMDWQDKKEFKQFINRQKKYQQMLENNTDKLQNNINELKEEENQSLNQKKEDLKKRLEEMKEMQKKQNILNELKKLAEKLDKENFIKKLDKLTQENKQKEKSLERILELTKRFYVEKKAEQIASKLQKLAKNQKELSKSEENTAKKQEELNKKFDDIKKEMSDLQKQNKVLKRPMDIPKKSDEQKEVTDDMKTAMEKLEDSEISNKKQSKESATKKQKSAAKKMQKMSGEMQKSMMSSGGEMMEEDIDNLRAIIENLIRFSLEQESLLNDFKLINVAHPLYAKKLKFQQVLKEHFEHIDDSIYSLSLRNPKISEKLNSDIMEAHYNLDQSLTNIADNKIKQGLLNQQTTMMSANNLADYLSKVLDAAQNPSMGEGEGKGKSGMGKGKGKGSGKGFQLPDIIKKQQELLDKAKGKKEGAEKKGDKGKDGKEGESGEGEGGKGKGNKKGKGNDSEQMSGEMFEIYKQQNALKQAFKNILNNAGKKASSSGNKALKQMENLEKELLDKGLTQSVLKKMEALKHELLKLDKASFEQGKDNKRKSDTNTILFKNRNIKKINSKKLFFNPNEILNREALPFNTKYKKKVQKYFLIKD